jgi:hypothetical protein
MTQLMKNNQVLTVHTVSIGDASDSTFVTCHLCEKELQRVPKGGAVDPLTVPGTYADLGERFIGKDRWQLVGELLDIDVKMCTSPQA